MNEAPASATAMPRWPIYRHIYVWEQHTGDGLVSSNLLLGGAGKSSSLLAGGGRTSRTCTELDPHVSHNPIASKTRIRRLLLLRPRPSQLHTRQEKSHIRRAIEVVKPRAMAGATAARRAAAIAVRCKNILSKSRGFGDWGREGGCFVGFEV